MLMQNAAQALSKRESNMLRRRVSHQIYLRMKHNKEEHEQRLWHQWLRQMVEHNAILPSAEPAKTKNIMRERIH